VFLWGKGHKVNVQISGQLYAHVKQESCIHLHYGLNYLEYMYMHCLCIFQCLYGIVCVLSYTNLKSVQMCKDGLS